MAKNQISRKVDVILAGRLFPHNLAGFILIFWSAIKMDFCEENYLLAQIKVFFCPPKKMSHELPQMLLSYKKKGFDKD